MRTFFVILIIAICLGCNNSKPEKGNPNAMTDETAHLAHENYVAAINSNNLDSLLEMLTNDVVFMSPNEPVMVGKDAVKPWLEGYLQLFKTYWEKPVHEFVVCGEWAFERYSYKSTDTSLVDGSVFEGTGWGLVIYHHDTDGKWRVARDAWGSDRLPQN